MPDYAYNRFLTGIEGVSITKVDEKKKAVTARASFRTQEEFEATFDDLFVWLLDHKIRRIFFEGSGYLMLPDWFHEKCKKNDIWTEFTRWKLKKDKYVGKEFVWILEKEKREKIKDSALFYPCSGNDLLVTIEIFSPYITDFWFVDRGYFSPGNQDTRHYGADAPADIQPPLLTADPRYKFLDKSIVGIPSWESGSPDIQPCILSESYTHNETGRKITIHRRRGYGFSALRIEPGLKRLGVIFIVEIVMVKVAVAIYG